MKEFIQSASGWRGIFSPSGDENDSSKIITNENQAIVSSSARAFLKYLNERGLLHPTIALARDTRPTGESIMNIVIKVFQENGAKIKNLNIAAAPEIMCYAANDIGHEKECDAFFYISASHNPIGHNGLKFGLTSGGVLDANENKKIVELYNKDFIATKDSLSADCKDCLAQTATLLDDKKKSLDLYRDFFIRRTTGALNDSKKALEDFRVLTDKIKEKGVAVIADFNGSARTASIDKKLFSDFGINFFAINDQEGAIAHEIIPEGKNLAPLAKAITDKKNSGFPGPVLGYMCDCDGDRGNIVIWDEVNKCARPLEAQEVFSLAAISALSSHRARGDKNLSIVCNCATSARIDFIARAFNAKVIRCEVGEANVVNCMREATKALYTVALAGEGSNGGVIAPPNFVRDPLDTIFFILKLISNDMLFTLWCERAGIFNSEARTLADIIATLPRWTTSETSDKLARVHIRTRDCTILEKRFQNLFLNEWEKKRESLLKDYGIASYEARISIGTKERRDIKDFSLAGTGGLKIVFFDASGVEIAFLWLRKSGTESILRLMVDAMGNSERKIKMKTALLSWLFDMIKVADE